MKFDDCHQKDIDKNYEISIVLKIVNTFNSYVLTCQSHQLNGVDFLLYKNGLRAEQTQYDG